MKRSPEFCEFFYTRRREMKIRIIIIIMTMMIIIIIVVIRVVVLFSLSLCVFLLWEKMGKKGTLCWLWNKEKGGGTLNCASLLCVCQLDDVTK